jgi:GT2 family glycosyltransferase
MMLYDRRERVNSHGNEANILLFSWPNGYMELVPQNDKPRKIPYASGCAAVYTRTCLEGIGGFDELFFMYFEDVELGLRAQLAGYDSRYSPSSVVYHKYRFKESPQRYFLLERNRILTMLIVFRKRTLLAISPLAIAAEFGVLAEAFFGGWYVEKIAAYGSLLRHAGHVLRKRKMVRDLRVRHDKELVQSLRGGVTFFPLRESAIVGIANKLSEKYRTFLLNMDI